jgi:hypothetical protein
MIPFSKWEQGGESLLQTCNSYIEDCFAAEEMPTLHDFLARIDFDLQEWKDAEATNRRSLAQGIKKCNTALVASIMRYAARYPNKAITCMYYCKATFSMYDRPYEDKSVSSTVNVVLDKAWGDLGK